VRSIGAAQYDCLIASIFGRSIDDDVAPKVADIFYGHLFQSDHVPPATEILPTCPDTTQAARALHLAVAKLQAEKFSFTRWVPFIHFGL
jgi:hypothetical protein